MAVGKNVLESAREKEKAGLSLIWTTTVETSR